VTVQAARVVADQATAALPRLQAAVTLLDALRSTSPMAHHTRLIVLPYLLSQLPRPDLPLSHANGEAGAAVLAFAREAGNVAYVL